MPSNEQNPNKATTWSESDSETFISYGRYFVPHRKLQIEIFCDLIPPYEGPFTVIELACGEGLLAEALLKRFPSCTVYGLDGSPAMLARAQAKLAPFGERFDGRDFDLVQREWRAPDFPVHAVLCSLSIHHLDGPGKQLLFNDVYAMLEPGGVFLIADLVEPASPIGTALAAKTWDQIVLQQTEKYDGDTAFYKRFVDEQWNYFRHPDPEDQPSPLLEQLQWLQSAGFAAVDVYWMNAGHAIFGGQKDS